jgi:glycosyltransferase involved in cell wall biosynthesis
MRPVRQESELPVVLCTDRLSPSIAYRTYSEPIAGRPFLQWWCDRFISRHSSDLSVLCHTAEDERAVAAIVSRRARVIRVESGTKVKAFAKAAQVVGAEHLAFVYYGIVFAPRGLLLLAFRHHVQHANSFTPVLGLPDRASPEIYQSGLLQELASLDLPEMASEPAEIILRLSMAAHTLRELQPCMPTATPFDAGRAFGASARLLPEGVSISTPRDIELARRAVAGGDSDDLKLLEHWRRCAIQVRSELSETLSQPLRSASLDVASRSRPGREARRRILFISEPAGFSGGEESLCQLISHLDRDLFEPYAFVGGDGAFAARLRSSRANVIIAPCGFGTSGVERLLYVLGVLHQVKPQVVHFNGPVDSPTLHAVVLTKVPFVAHARNALLTGDLDALRLATRIIAVSEFTKERVLRLDVAEHRVSVLYDEVDPSSFASGAFDKDELRAQFGIAPRARVALLIARLVPNKRHDLFLKAAIEAKSHIPRLHLVLKADVFVDDAAADRVVDFIEAHSMKSWVTTVPFVDDIRKMHSLADVLVLCSDDEALGRCVVEAMAMEIPVIVSDSGGSHEIVRDGETGFVFPGGNAGALARCLVEALSDSGRHKNMGRAARRHVIEHLTALQSAAKVSDLYEEVLSANSSKAAAPGSKDRHSNESYHAPAGPSS